MTAHLIHRAIGYIIMAPVIGFVGTCFYAAADMVVKDSVAEYQNWRRRR